MIVGRAISLLLVRACRGCTLACVAPVCFGLRGGIPCHSFFSVLAFRDRPWLTSDKATRTLEFDSFAVTFLDSDGDFGRGSSSLRVSDSM